MAEISVIVPVYKVEPYLRKCLDSILAQTYAELEIILVDDGSPDNCPAICDEYAEKDSRIKVIHKQNGGLSSARNAGLDTAVGAWIGFVDSDDWIEPDMFEYLLTGAEKEGADIAICGHYEIMPWKKKRQGVAEQCVYEKEEAVKVLLQDTDIRNYAWDKLYKRELFDNIRFPEAKTFEDVYTTYKIFEKADCIVCLPEAKYNYLQRTNSIMDDTSLKNRISYFDATLSRYEDMRRRWPQLSYLLEAQCVKAAVSIWASYRRNSKAEQLEYKEKIQYISTFSKQHMDAARASAAHGLAGRMILRLVPHCKWWAYLLAELCGFLYKIKHGRQL